MSISAANQARDAYEEADRRLRDLEREIRQLEESVSKDYGPDEEFQVISSYSFLFKSLILSSFLFFKDFSLLKFIEIPLN